MKIKEEFCRIEFFFFIIINLYVADEEWMASPFYKNSKVKIASGMIFQIDIIPSVEGLAGVSAEECVAIADQSLKNELKNEYPELWQRIIM